jgi:hypothetical protein
LTTKPIGFVQLALVWVAGVHAVDGLPTPVVDVVLNGAQDFVPVQVDPVKAEQEHTSIG